MLLTINQPVEIVGASMGDNNRQCGLNPTACGLSVTVGSTLKLLKSTIQISESSINLDQRSTTTSAKKLKIKKKSTLIDTLNSVNEETIAVYKYSDNISSCCIGFVSKAFQSVYGEALHGRIVEVKRLLRTSDCESECMRSKMNNGLIHAIIVG